MHQQILVAHTLTSAFGTLRTFLGVLSGLSYVIIISVLNSSVDSRATNKHSVSWLSIEINLLRSYRTVVHQFLLLRIVFQARCSFVDFLAANLILSIRILQMTL